ncbi:MAG: NAD(+) synthase [Gemmataceae bacterium]|nr:NAD(+) synthase [Gemmata sp.]MDW8198595.1 NAD(+) synthase [Gemmataceae bacterium]
MKTYGFLRVAAARPLLRIADCPFNAQQTVQLLAEAETRGVNVVVFPECGLTGYTCHDLFHLHSLQQAAADALEQVVCQSGSIYRGVAVVGVPLAFAGQLFNCAAVIHAGRILGVVPKTYLANYKEFYDGRYFSPAPNATFREVNFRGQVVPFGTDILFRCRSWCDFLLGVEICEDLWPPIPPSSLQALAGATVVANLSASNEVIGKASYRRQLVCAQSGRCIAGYVYACSGWGESTTDVVFGGHALIAENGVLLAESQRFQRQAQLLVADLDLDRLQHDRVQTTSFNDARRCWEPAISRFRQVEFDLEITARQPALARPVEAHPFVPQDVATRDDRCRDIFQTQVAALAQRLTHVGLPPVAIGLSGGLDSTLAFLVVCKTFDQLGIDRNRILALTLPGFGTTARTKKNALDLAAALNVPIREIDIRPLCLEQMRLMGHSPFGISLTHETVESLTEKLRHLPPEKRHDLTFENTQARIRTTLLMNSGFVIGTGDLSEIALGWCTYNADHMSMYNPNASIPKTLVKFLVQWAAENEFAGSTRATLLDIVRTEITPELLPTDTTGAITQATEATVGPYELVDFFLYHFLRFGSAPEKILFLAQNVRFDRDYAPAELRRWLGVFVKRFFANQFKRSCLPDGPKVGTVSLSPRGDWRMPSDAQVRIWLENWEKTAES